MNQDLIEESFRVATRLAGDRGMQIDEAVLRQAIVAVAGDRNGQDEPCEIAEDALDLLGKDAGPSSSRRGRRPF
ncbi:MAG: hypothetical protein ACR652_26145 [Methylocystis sp.]|uniref:hypothetical protein n=1 Tax=Methylocystis sp. TaxID=1911079 RepID=UPI003DA6B47A